MYCKICGAQNNDEAAFCCECGAGLEVEQANSTLVNSNNLLSKLKGLSKEKKIGLCVALGAVIAGLILLIVLLSGGHSWQRTAEGYVNAAIKGDLIKAASYMPAKYIDAMLEEEDMSRKEFNEELKDSGDSIKEDLEDNNIKIKEVKIIGYRDGYEKDDIKDRKENYKDRFNVTLNISEMKTVYVRVYYTEDGDKDSTDMTLTLMNVGGKWCIAPESFNGFSPSY